MCIGFCSKRFRPVVASLSTMARHRSGTAEDSIQWGVSCRPWLRRPSTRMPWCGEETHSWHHINRVSSCWDHLLGKRPSSRHSCPPNEHQVLLDRIPCVSDVQTAWLLLPFCGATRANYWIRTVSPRFSGGFVQEHD